MYRVSLFSCNTANQLSHVWLMCFFFSFPRHWVMICAGNFSMSTGMITAHQLYNYITDHAGTYGMKPLRMSKAAVNIENKKGGPSADLHEYALVALWNRYDSSVSHQSFVEIIKGRTL